MLLFTALFGGLMLLSIESRRRMVAVLLIGCIAILGVSPPPAQAQFCLPCVIQAVLATISQTIGNWLSVINGVVSDIRKLYEQTIWPISAINLAKSQIQSIIARFRGVIQSIMTINPHTATLPNPAALENIIRNRGTGDLGTVPQVYVNAFRPVPQAGAIAPQDRDMTDMDDALAQDNLMLLKVADQAQDLELQAADQIESLVGNPNINVSAPGSSSLITAAAVSAEIKSQAIMQKMMAAMLRQEAGRVAHDNAIRKRTATFGGFTAIAVICQTNSKNTGKKSSGLAVTVSLTIPAKRAHTACSLKPSRCLASRALKSVPLRKQNGTRKTGIWWVDCG